MIDRYSEDLTTLSNLLDILEEANQSVGIQPTSWISDLVTQIINAFKRVFGGIFSNIEETAKNIYNWVKSKLDTGISNARDAIKAFIAAARELILDRIDSVKSYLGTVETNIRRAISNGIDNVSTWIANARDNIKAAVTNTVNKVADWIDNAQTAIVTTVNTGINKVSGWINTAADGIKSKIDAAVSAVSSTLGSVADKISQAIQSLVNAVHDIAGSIGNAISGAISQLIGGIRSAVSSLADTVASTVKVTIDNLRDSFSGIIRSIYDNLSAFIATISTWLSNMINTLKQIVSSVYENIAQFIHNIIESLKQKYEETKQSILAFMENVRQTILQKIVDAMLFFNTIVDQAQKAFWAAAQAVGKWIADWLLPHLGGAIEVAKILRDLFMKIWHALLAGNFEQAFDIVDGFVSGLGVPAPIEALHAIVSAIAYFFETVRLQFVPLEVAASKQAEINLALNPPPADNIISAYFRGEASRESVVETLRLAGVNRKFLDEIIAGSRPLPTPGSIQEAFLRGEITEEEHDNYLRAYGYTDKDIKLFKSLYFIIPTPSDLIRMAVKEVFTPDIAEKFGQYEDFPDVFAEWAYKIGLSKEWARAYWAAHWDLPSPQMGFEMLHRGVITEEELKLLLRALDVMPFWREKLIKISYSPLTRVDVRRMYKLGVLNEEQVKRAYLDLGYDEEKATWLTEFTKRYSAPEDQSELDEFRALARTTYSQAYRKHIINREEYRQFLLNMKYHPDDVELLISLDDYAIADKEKIFDLNDYRKDYQKLAIKAYELGLLSDDDLRSILSDLGYDDTEITLEINLIEFNRQLKIRDIIADRLHEMYTEYIIDASQLAEMMSYFGFTADEQEKLMQEWNVERYLRSKRPPLTDLKRFLNAGLITLEEFLDELRGMGYHEKYINLYAQALA